MFDDTKNTGETLFPTLTDAGRHQQLVEWNATSLDYPCNTCLHQLFEAQVERVPGAVAIISAGRTITYDELNKQANQLAYVLRQVGVGPDVVVGVCMERSPELIVAFLGILKAGGVYTPLEPAYPQERLDFMVRDAHISFLLTQHHLEHRLPPGAQHIIALDNDWAATLPTSARQNCLNQASPENLAYVMYTSGSTGTPKGIAIRHNGIVNNVFDLNTRFHVGVGDSVLALSAISFDMSIYESLGILAAGGAVVIPRPELARDAAHWITLLNRYNVTLWHTAPALLEMLVEHIEAHRELYPGSLRLAMISGDRCSLSLLGRLKALAKELPIVNLGGATEASIYSTIYSFLTPNPAWKSIPYGRPMANQQAYILDASLQPVPPGVPGELYLGGTGLARGYLYRPGLTAERFIPHPFAQTPGERVYRTGDLARYLPDGAIDLLGRIDFQVKVRGLRIELGEIEAALCAHPSVQECVVLARDEAGEKRLVAYVIPAADRAIALDEMRDYLRQRLPDYMVPSAFLQLTAWPLSPNGKLDRAALPPPVWDGCEQGIAYVAPQTPIERKLAAIWEEVLPVKRVGLRDNFFALGGHSLLATQMLSRLRSAFQVEIPLHALFDSPTLASLAGRVKQAHDEKQPAGIFSMQTPVPAHSSPSIPRSFPLSLAQQRLWFLNQLEPDNPGYNILTALRFSGHLDVAALERGLDAIVQRHAILRTAFTSVQGYPIQVIAPALKPALPVIDLAGLPEGAAKEAEVQRLSSREARHPFNLAERPLMRTNMLRLSECEHVLLVNMHHIISDGWSVTVFVQELERLYTAFTQGKDADARDVLPQLPLQYAEYAVWQRQWLEGQLHPAEGGEAPLSRQVEYWKQQLKDAPAALELPTDHPRPTAPAYQRASKALMLDSSLAGLLSRLNQRAADETGHGNYTLFMLLLAVFQIVLARHTGEEDMLVGTPFANRNRVEVEQLIGFFMNTLVLRTDLSGDPTFRELLARVRAVCLGAYANQDVPFDRLIEELNPQRDLGRTPLFQVFFNLLNYPARALAWPELHVEIYWPGPAGIQFDLTLYAQEFDEGIRLEAHYNAELFEPNRIQALLEQFRSLVAQIVTNPDIRLSQLSLVTPAARTLLPDPTAPLSATWEGSVTTLFTRQARLAPARPALSDAHGTWSYRELDERSNQIANYLHAQGIGPQAMVAIYAWRSASLVWALLGVLKAGAAYLILDSAYPAGRLIEYLRMAQVDGFLHLEGAGPLPPEVEETLTTGMLRCRLQLPLRPTGPCEALAHMALDDPGVVVGPDDIACLAFTSGSTGQPRGILQRHGPLSHFLPWQQQTFDLTANDRYSMLAGLAHDPLQRDIFTPLCLGATLCVPTQETITTPGQLAAWMQQECISITNLTPAMLRLLTQPSRFLRSGHTLPSLRYAFVVGDVLTRSDVASLQAIAPAVTCVNLYGATESQRALGYFVVPSNAADTPAAREAKEIVPLGRGYKDAQLLVLNRSRSLAGIGELGEIAIRSPHLARGYLADEALTRERFFVNPFTHMAADRIYITGDLGRYDPDGNVVHAGRNDLQVKLRGFRIELAEIEAALRLHDAVREAAVIAREDHSGEKRLVAYIVPEAARVTTSSLPRALWQFLRARLPNYMLPSAFVLLDALPLLPNHKVDRHALQLIAPTSHREAADHTGPRTPQEEILANLWKQVLGIEEVGIHENFFELGGHSLMATRLLARVIDIFHVNLPLRVLFEAPTVASFAVALERQSKRTMASGQPALVPLAREGIHHNGHSSNRGGETTGGEYCFVPSFAQERLWFLDELESNSASYNILLSLRLQGSLNIPALQHSLNILVRRHEALRTTLRVIDDARFQVVAARKDIPLTLIDLVGLAEGGREAAMQRLAFQATELSFNLSTGPLVRPLLVRLCSNEHALLVSLHHAIADGWSSELLLREWSALYNAFVAGEADSPLPEPALQYADYASWQRAWLRGNALAEQVAYWREYLRAAPAVLNLPTDRPRPALQTHRGARYSFTLPDRLASELRMLSRQESVTLFMTLLAGFQTLLLRYSGQTDIVVGTTVAGRTRVELEPLIGLFANVLAVRADLSGDPSVHELLQRTREACLRVYEHQEMPFERLVEELQPARSLSYHPVFQVLFGLQNFAIQPVQFTGVTACSFEVPRATARFDLACDWIESAGQLTCRLEYNADLFEHATIVRLGKHLYGLLESMAANPQQRLSRLPPLTEVERQQMLVEWNATEAAYPLHERLHRLFERQVSCTPEALAVTCEDHALSYGEVNRRANQLARYLQRRGVVPTALVGLCVERSLDMLVGLLAILKAGAAYVPLDPAYPRERLAFMLADARTGLPEAGHLSHVLTRQDLLQALPETTVHLVALDSEWDEIAREPGEDLPRQGDGEELAYVIYTSGSTGQPKGVLGTHRATLNRLYWMWEQFPFAADEICCQKTSLSFVDSIWEIFGPLLHGVRTAIIPDETVKDAYRLVPLLAEQGVTRIVLVPSLLSALLSLHLDVAQYLSGVRYWISSGEVLPLEVARSLLARLPHSVLINLYGSSEVAADATYALVRADQNAAGLPIGHPIANTQIYLLDAWLQPVPPGVPAELYVGGAGLSRGYLHQPGLTAERFLPHPFSQEPGARLYRTGDLARFLPDGTLEYLGRADRQVKLRGYRIELGEIEALLRQHPAVRQGIVVAQEAESGEKRLAAYVVPQEADDAQSAQALTAELQAFLKRQLPEYMLPTMVVCVPAFPLLPNGKVDQGSVASLEIHTSVPATPGQALVELSVARPPTPVEEVLLEIWSDILGHEHIGLYDNFFDLGGHSLLATQVISRVRSLFQVDLSVVRLFEAPAVAEFAEALIQDEFEPGQMTAIANVRLKLKKMSAQEIRERLKKGKKLKSL